MPETLHLVPPDQQQREAALDLSQSLLVQAPAGSGKTSLLTQRFLALLGEVDDPSEIVAITFTRAAAAEMRSRILSEIEKAANPANETPANTLALRALERSRERGWNLLDQPAQLRISTIDAFCRELALQQPLVSGLGGGMEIAAQPELLYRRAARRTLEGLDQASGPLQEAVETLLLWRDNNWSEMESLLVTMLKVRDRWMRDFVLERDQDFDELRTRLERPFARAVATHIERLTSLFAQTTGVREEILVLARFACEQSRGRLHQPLAQAAEFPSLPFASPEELEDAQQFFLALANFALTGDGAFRKRLDKNLGFPSDCKNEKSRMSALLQTLAAIPALEENLVAMRTLPPARYTDGDWRIVRAAFTLLAHAAAQLRIVFAEEGATDYTEIAQTALQVLKGDDGLPNEATLAFADGIHHLLVDEFQDTSRRQHELLSYLVAAWPETVGRTCFVVGDPMQSIYFFREAEAELFARVRDYGLDLPGATPLPFRFAELQSNFRTAHDLVRNLNEGFGKIFAEQDGSGIDFHSASPARGQEQFRAEFQPQPQLHLAFIPAQPRTGALSSTVRKQAVDARTTAQREQIDEIVSLIERHQKQIDVLRKNSSQEKYRVAVLGRTKSVLMKIASSLRKAEIPFRAVGIENLKDRPEIADALALARALFNAEDRLAWLGVLRAPWCGLSLADLHALTSADNPLVLDQPISSLLKERIDELTPDGRKAVSRVRATLTEALAQRAAEPQTTLGTWLAKVWSRLGGEFCYDATARANLDLFWQTLDNLSEGGQDLLGPALDAALSELTAQPDPTVDEQRGVQLMTMHKSKGLEFEVVIVPELQAGSGRSDKAMLSWLERGLAHPDAEDESTEFLVAPIQSKGTDSGTAKTWVDGERRKRERQEMRRLLYVAATRAREELHLFARLGCKTVNEELTLSTPHPSLLQTAWPALEEEIGRRFAAWRAEQTASTPEEEPLLESLAASASNDQPTRLFRLPPSFSLAASPQLEQQQSGAAVESAELYVRHEGGLRSRALGTAVHLFLEELSRLRAEFSWTQARTNLSNALPRATAALRSTGFERGQAEHLAEEELSIALDASHTPEGEWILSPHTEAASEQRWSGVLSGALRTVQVDRLFRAGAEPLTNDGQVWWIVDYKTAHPEGIDPASAAASLRASFAPQLEIYAEVLRALHGADATIHAALFYPRMKLLDWWKI